MSYSIIQADLQKDKQSIISLWKKNFQQILEGRYSWIYENNPSGLPVCFLLKYDGDNSIVGTISLFPRAMFLQGQRIQAYICGDLVVDKKHRSLGPALSLFKAAISKCEGETSSILISVPNKSSEPVSLRAGFQILGEYTQMTRIIKTYPYIRKKLKLSFFPRLISIPLDVFLYFRNLDLNTAHSKSCHYEILENVDDRFDNFGRQLIGRYSLKGEVCESHLNWRFIQSPYADYKIFAVSQKGVNNLIAYLVYFMTNNRIQIVDFAFNNSESAPDILFSSFYRRQKSLGIDSIALSFVGSSKLIDQLKKNRFSERSRESKIIVYAPSSHKEIISEMKVGYWYLTSADNDV